MDPDGSSAAPVQPHGHDPGGGPSGLRGSQAGGISGRLAGGEKEGAEGRRTLLKAQVQPGVGDFSIHHQKALLQRLEAPKRIGLTMTDGYMLTPSKSVTALAGISPEETAATGRGAKAAGRSTALTVGSKRQTMTLQKREQEGADRC